MIYMFYPSYVIVCHYYDREGGRAWPIASFEGKFVLENFLSAEMSVYYKREYLYSKNLWEIISWYHLETGGFNFFN